MAKDFGATNAIDASAAKWRERVMALTDGTGVDVSIEAAGLPETFTMAVDVTRPGGHLASIGVHGTGVDLPLQDLWSRNISISMGLVNTNTTLLLLKLVSQHKIPAAQFATHFFDFEHMLDAYDTFAHAAETKALKVIITRTRPRG